MLVKKEEDQVKKYDVRKTSVEEKEENESEMRKVWSIPKHSEACKLR